LDLGAFCGYLFYDSLELLEDAVKELTTTAAFLFVQDQTVCFAKLLWHYLLYEFKFIIFLVVLLFVRVSNEFDHFRVLEGPNVLISGKEVVFIGQSRRIHLEILEYMLFWLPLMQIHQPKRNKVIWFYMQFISQYPLILRNKYIELLLKHLLKLEQHFMDLIQKLLFFVVVDTDYDEVASGAAFGVSYEIEIVSIDVDFADVRE
jgi:hypothetical protein